MKSRDTQPLPVVHLDTLIDLMAEPGAQAVKSMVGEHFLWTPDGKRRAISQDVINQVVRDDRFERMPAMMADGTSRYRLVNAPLPQARRSQMEGI